jgi:serine/threonine protein kinase
MRIEDVKRELDILKKLSHKHVVTLLGSYTKNRILGLLLHPVAVCDLGLFLDELDEYQRLDPPHPGEGLEKLMDRLGFPRDVHRARERLNGVYGCLANAVQYLHEHDIRHKDIKPRNILLDRNDGLYITDFGLSRDTADASSSVTNGIERGTYKYRAPEVARYEPRGRAADVYSLGCVFLEINTVHRRLSLAAFDDFRTENEDRSFQNNPQKLLEWMSKLRQISIDTPDSGVFDMVYIIEKMVSPNPSNRPVIGAVCSSLYVLGDLVYFGKCCVTPRYQALVNEKGHLRLSNASVQKTPANIIQNASMLCCRRAIDRHVLNSKRNFLSLKRLTRRMYKPFILLMNRK